jgi:UDP-glucose 4-epimerase
MRGTLMRDLVEVERLAQEFALRVPEATVTTLRLAPALGGAQRTPFGDYFALPIVPTIFGFNPRLQFIDCDDAVGAVMHAVGTDVAGTFNVAGKGVVLLSQTLAMLHKQGAPIVPFIGAGSAIGLLKRFGMISMSSHMVRLLQYGCVTDTSALSHFGWQPERTTPDIVRALASGQRRAPAPRRAALTFDGDVEEFLRAKGRRAAAGPVS